jgi:hypothetical protein
MSPGVYESMPMAEYLALPALSQEPVRLIIDQCERAAWWSSYLNTNKPRTDTDGTDAGTIAHAILLEGSEAGVAIIDPADHPNVTKDKDGVYATPTGWGNKSIRAARDAARAAGKIPLLPDKIGDIRAMVEAAREFIESCRKDEPAIWEAFQPGRGQSELTMLWKEGDTLCRMRADRIHDDRSVICDYKGSAQSVEPERFGRVQLPAYSIGAAWYQRGCEKLTGKRPAYVYLAQECEPPYLCSLVGSDPARLALAHEKVQEGLARWQECVKLGRWAGYPPRVVYPEIKPWEIDDWMRRQGVEMDSQGIPYDIAKLFPRTDQ